MTKSNLRTLRVHGLDLARRAYQLHHGDGEGASTVGIYLGVSTRTADALINAGRAIAHIQGPGAPVLVP